MGPNKSFKYDLAICGSYLIMMLIPTANPRTNSECNHESQNISGTINQLSYG
jgi:hypothetical protein